MARGRCVALGGAAQQRREAETLARPQPSGLERVDRSWYVAPPRADARDEAAAHLSRAAYGHLVPMDDAGAGVLLEPHARRDRARRWCALGRRRVALAFVGAPRAGLAQLCARLGEPHATQLVDEVRALKAAPPPPDAVKAAQRALLPLGRWHRSPARALFFRVGAAWLAPALARDGDELLRAAQRLPRALGQLLARRGRRASARTASAAAALVASGATARCGPYNPAHDAIPPSSLWRSSLPLAGCGYNSLVSGDESVKAAWAQVENVYQRRADLIPNLVNTVKGSAQHEEKVLTEVTAARASATQVKLSVDDLSNPEKVKQFEEAQAKLSSSLGRLIATSESYPDLKANAAFRDLMAQLEGTENRISVERKRYNDAVRDYNVKTPRVPDGDRGQDLGLPARRSRSRRPRPTPTRRRR